MMFRIVFWDVLPCKIIVDRRSLMVEAVRTSETSVDNYFTRQYIPEDNSEHQEISPLLSVSRPALGPTLPPVQWVPGVFSPGVDCGRGVTLTPHLI
jgi:hypothetical protein